MADQPRANYWYRNQKTRPAVVVNSDYIGKLSLKLVVPITNWQSSFTE